MHAADAIGATSMRIVTGEIEEDTDGNDGQNKAAVTRWSKRVI